MKKKEIKKELVLESGSLETGVSIKESDFESKNISFSENGIKNILKFTDVLKGVHLRLIAEGYVIKDGEVHCPQSPHSQS
ncbi:MAG: hypothetical protein WAX85_01255 [Minisyncoccia bacterium]